MVVVVVAVVVDVVVVVVFCLFNKFIKVNDFFAYWMVLNLENVAENGIF